MVVRGDIAVFGINHKTAADGIACRVAVCDIDGAAGGGSLFVYLREICGVFVICVVRRLEYGHAHVCFAFR